MLCGLLLVGCASTPRQSFDGAVLEIPAPASDDGIRRYHGFSLSFDAQFRVAKWAGYSLTPEKVSAKVAKRQNDFHKDFEVPSCPEPEDYSHSGYDRGHLIPAEDLRWSKEALHDSFAMSNMAPQTPRFNRGLWKKLESRVREWARRHVQLFVTVGPVLKAGCRERIASGICAPVAFYKVILEQDGSSWRAIGFLIPQAYERSELKSYAHSVDEVERATGLDFFASLPDDVESHIESRAQFAEWFTPKELAKKAGTSGRRFGIKPSVE